MCRGCITARNFSSSAGALPSGWILRCKVNYFDHEGICPPLSFNGSLQPNAIRAARFLGLTACLAAIICGCTMPGRQTSVVRVKTMPNSELADEQYTRGVELYQAGSFVDAKVCLQQACQLDPTNGAAHNNLALVYLEQRRLAEAADNLERAIELLPGDPRPLNNLAMTLEVGGREVEAIELYEAAWGASNGNAVYLGNLVRAKIRSSVIDDILLDQLRELQFVDSRSDWRDWAAEQLVLLERASPRSPDLGQATLPGYSGVRQSISDAPQQFELVQPVAPLDLEPSSELPKPK